MMLIFIVIDLAELQPLRDCGSEADFALPQRGDCLKHISKSKVWYDQKHPLFSSGSLTLLLADNRAI
jgi:hypothetical protein